MNNLYKNAFTGLTFISGLIGFLSGEYIISSALFAATTYTSSIDANRKQQD